MKIVGALIILVGVAVAAYLGVWVFFVGGITDVLDGIDVEPNNNGMIAWGLAKALVLAEIVWAVCAALSIWVGGALMVTGSTKRRRL